MPGPNFFRHVAVVVLALPVAAIAQSTITVVSTADFGPIVAPGSIAAVFGNNLANTHAAAALDSSGNLPASLEGTSVSINGEAARLFYVSPGQVNFVIPDDIAVGTANISVSSPAIQGPITGTAQVQLAAPGIYTIACLRTDRGAVGNGVTGDLEPFQATTQQNSGSDKRTRLSIYGTGFRFADNPTRTNSIPSTSHVTAKIIDAGGNIIPIAVEYAGKQGTLFGLDQINVVLPVSADGLGLVTLQLSVDGVPARPVTVILSPKTTASSQSGDLAVATVAGNGTAGSAGDNGPAVLAQLQNPNGVIFDSNHNLYIADADNHIVRIINAAGLISTFAGTGTAGFSGDNGPAASAQLRRPVALAMDSLGNLYVSDAGDNRVRKISSAGIITTVAGNGSAAFSGDSGPATSASLNAPGGVAVNSSGTLFIADTANNRVRQVTSDGLIATIAGTGVAAANTEPSAYLAPLSSPTDVATDAGGNVFIADSGNFIIRRIATDGSIATIAGAGVQGSTGTNCPASQALFNSPLHIASDEQGRLLIADTNNQRIRTIDANCSINYSAGGGTAGFSGDGNVLRTQLNNPEGITADQVGNIYFADSANQRIRKLSLSGASATVTFAPPSGTFGQAATLYFDLGTPSSVATSLAIGSNVAIVGLPAAITIPPGQTTIAIPFIIPNVTSPTPITVTFTGSAGVTSGTLNAFPKPAGSAQPASLTFSSDSIPAGQTTTGTVKLNMAAPAGGTTVSLSSNPAGARLASSVMVPAGQTSSQFLISAEPTAAPGTITISGTASGATVSHAFNVTPAGPTPLNIVPIANVDLGSANVSGGQSTTGTVTLTNPAPAGGASVALSSSTPVVTVPFRISVTAGSLTATFPVNASPVTTPVTGSISATGTNVITAHVTVTPSTNTQATVSAVSLSPTILIGGQSVTGTITLSAPAGVNGASATITSDNPALTAPATVTVSAGATSATFPITTTPVATPTEATVTLTSANSVSTSITINPPAGAVSGTIASVAVNPLTITGGQNAAGTVTLVSPAGASGVSVGLTTTVPGATVPATVVVPSGSATATFQIATSPVATSVTGNIIATSVNSIGVSVTVTPTALASVNPTSVTFNPGSVTGGQSATGTVGLSAPAPAGGGTVRLSSTSSAVTVPASVTIPGGQSTATFTATTKPVASATAATIAASSEGNSTSGVLTVNSPCPAFVSVSLGALDSGANALLTATATLNGPAPIGGTTVALNTNGSSLGTVAVPQGTTSGSTTIGIANALQLIGKTINTLTSGCPVISATIN